jgi:hypothetical protein
VATARIADNKKPIQRLRFVSLEIHTLTPALSACLRVGYLSRRLGRAAHLAAPFY